MSVPSRRHLMLDGPTQNTESIFCDAFIHIHLQRHTRTRTYTRARVHIHWHTLQCVAYVTDSPNTHPYAAQVWEFLDALGTPGSNAGAECCSPMIWECRTWRHSMDPQCRVEGKDSSSPPAHFEPRESQENGNCGVLQGRISSRLSLAADETLGLGPAAPTHKPSNTATLRCPCQS